MWTVRKQVIRSGFSNLTAHIFSEHLDWHEQYKATNKSKTILNFISKKNIHIYSCLDWVFSELLNFNFVNKEKTRGYTKLEPISTNTLLKYTELLTTKVEEKISMCLPPTFGIVLDGWTHNDIHYLAIFAVYFK